MLLALILSWLFILASVTGVWLLVSSRTMVETFYKIKVKTLRLFNYLLLRLMVATVGFLSIIYILRCLVLLYVSMV